MDSMIAAELWWNGPQCMNHIDVPETEEFSETHNEIVECIVQNQIAATKVTEIKSPILDLNEHSNLQRVLRITAWVYRFIHNVRSAEPLKGELSADEMQNAERYWILNTQNECFHTDIENLHAGKELHRHSKLLTLNPFIDECGILRVGGRLQKSALPHEVKHPQILPTHHRFSELLVRRAHEEVLHSGVSDTLIQVRESSWILRGRQLSKKVVLKCLMCQSEAQPAKRSAATKRAHHGGPAIRGNWCRFCRTITSQAKSPQSVHSIIHMRSYKSCTFGIGV